MSHQWKSEPLTQSRKLTPLPLVAADFDDMLDELDPEFQKSLKVALKVPGRQDLGLRRYMKERMS